MSNRYTCMVVEDDPMFLELLKNYIGLIPDLRLLACCSDTVASSVKIQRYKPQILFLDINISGLDGPDLINLLEHRPEIVIISGNPREVMRNYSIAIADYLQKPVKFEAFESAVAKGIRNLQLKMEKQL